MKYFAVSNHTNSYNFNGAKPCFIFHFAFLNEETNLTKTKLKRFAKNAFSCTFFVFVLFDSTTNLHYLFGGHFMYYLRNVETASISQLNDVNPSTGLTYTKYSASWFTYISFTFKQYFYVCLSNYDVMFSTLLWSHWRHAFMGIHRFEYIQIFIVDVFVFMNFSYRIAVAGKTKNKC